MKYNPILFSAPMVRALLDGSKTRTRRVVKPQPQMVTDHKVALWEGDPAALLTLLNQSGRSCPYGKPSDRLWVRETWAAPHSEDGRPPSAIQCDQMRIHYAASEDRGGLLWRPSIHMPRWASRITLEITGVRVQRLCILNAEAKAISHVDL